MLDQMIESKSNGTENARKNGFLLATLTVLGAVLLSGWTYSLFAKNYGVGSGEFDMASLVSPVNIAPDVPPPVPVRRERTQNAASKKVILEEIYEDIGRGDVPDTTTGKKNVISARQFGPNVQKGDRNFIPEGGGRDTGPIGEACELCDNPQDKVKKPQDDDLGEVKPKKPVADPTPKRAVPISLGPVNGRATFLPKPVYSAAAQAVRANGQVQIQVTIDEQGRVTSASVASGHPLLRNEALAAARISKFTPTTLGGQPVKVTGIIIYNFLPR